MKGRQNHTNKSEEDNEVFEKPSVFELSCSLLNAKNRDTIRYWKNPNQQTTWKTEALYLPLKQA